MTPELNQKAKAIIVRKGNEFFNGGDMANALKCYNSAAYDSGIEKIADRFYFDEHDPATAMQLYKKLSNARAKEKLAATYKSMAAVLREWLNGETVESLKEKRRAKTGTVKRNIVSVDDKLKKAHFYIRETKR